LPAAYHDGDRGAGSTDGALQPGQYVVEARCFAKAEAENRTVLESVSVKFNLNAGFSSFFDRLAAKRADNE
jgi:hypothetical protein